MGPKHVAEAAQETMSVSDAARHLSLSPSTVYQMVNEFRAIRVDGRWRFRVSDLEEWILRQRHADELPAEPVTYPGREVRLHPYIDVRNVFLDAPETHAAPLIQAALKRARLALAGASGGAEETALREQLCRSVAEREELSSTAFHPEVAYPHPKEADRSLLSAHQIVVVRSLAPVDFHDACAHRPRLVFILLARTISVQLIWEARFSYLVHRERLVPRLLAARSEEEVFEVFRQAEDENRD